MVEKLRMATLGRKEPGFPFVRSTFPLLPSGTRLLLPVGTGPFAPVGCVVRSALVGVET